MEVLDSIVKVKEFNLYSDTEFKLGFARNWFRWGLQCEAENGKV